MVRLRGSLLVASIVAAVGCGELLGSALDEPFAETDGAAPDAFVPDVAAEAMGTEAGADVTTQLLRNGGFEMACDFWTAQNGSASATTQARSGTGACLVCKNVGAPTTLTLFQTVPMALLPGQTFRARFHARAPDSGTDASAQRITIDTMPADQTSTAGTPPTADWLPLSLAHASADGGTRVIVSYRFVGGPGDCMIIDDATLTTP